MNPVEIEEAVSRLAESPFDSESFPYAFLEAFGNKPTTIQRLRSGSSNKTDIDGALLQHNNIHIAAARSGGTLEMLAKLKGSAATTRHKARFVLATDGKDFQAEDLISGETIVCDYNHFPDHFGFFLPLAGISTVKQIRDSSFDIKATGRLNRLYVELLKDNPVWGKTDRRHDMNHFMARLIFCFFAEDTDIFKNSGLFSKTVETMSAKDSSNTHEVISEMFRAMNTKTAERAIAKLPRWVEDFPYVNGGLFSGATEVPKFSKIARSYLLHIANLDWRKINPDIFGSMIQAVAEDEERGALGMHYTSVPNILKVLNPLFLDDLRTQLEKAADNPRALLNLRKRISKIRVFDPACGSGNFLVIAYKEMRAIEAEINKRRGEPDVRTEIQLTNFRGIELRDFPAEIARLALIIAEYQCDVLYRGQMEALLEFLPLEAENWIVCGNALQIEWESVCPSAPNDSESETYICGNPPYLGSTWQSAEQKKDLATVFDGRSKGSKLLDYVSGWFMKAAIYGSKTNTSSAFVSTKSICQGQQVPLLWPAIFSTGHYISFAHTAFNWANLATHNAGVTVVIVGISNLPKKGRRLYSLSEDGSPVLREVECINAYLTPSRDVIVEPEKYNRNGFGEMVRGNTGNDGGNLYLTPDELNELDLTNLQKQRFVRQVYGSDEFIKGTTRYCLWIEDEFLEEAKKIASIAKRIDGVRMVRLESKDAGARKMAARSHQFREMNQAAECMVVTPRVSSENRPYLPVGLLKAPSVISDRNFAIYDGPIWYVSLIASRLHWVWVGTVCVRMRTDFSYSNTLGWNTFPVPKLTEKNQRDLTQCAENILLAREAHFPASIADLYDPTTMPDDLRRAHEQNDEILERIYIGRRFKNDSERLEKLFELYTKVTASAPSSTSPKKRSAKSAGGKRKEMPA